ncbi:MAG: aspartate kinase [Dehalococcoidia bacterium]
MPIIVQKYGGSSLADAARISHVADSIAQRRSEGNQLVVVVSAMGKTTDNLFALARQVTDQPSERELDVLLSTGEIVSSALMAMALRQLGVDSISLTGFQAGIQTDRMHRKARILNVDPKRIHRELERGSTVIVAGFQGFNEELDITTLGGRGGSDTNAVALAAALEAERSEIYTDVEGIFTADPRIEPRARKLVEIGYDEMLEMASHGARVMHPRAVELGEVYQLPILVASSFTNVPGTLIHGGPTVEPTNKVRGIAHDYDVAKITVLGVPDRPGIASSLFEPLADAAISVDTIVQNSSLEHLTDLTFTVGRDDLARALPLVQPVVEQIGARGLSCDEHLAKVSIVGTGMQNTPGYASRMFRTLFDAGVNIQLITTSEIRITCIIAEDRVADAVSALHRAFERDRVDAWIAY